MGRRRAAGGDRRIPAADLSTSLHLHTFRHAMRSNASRLQDEPLNQAALHMLHCRIDTATLSPSSHADESCRSRKIAFVPGLEWL
jgi:hypothetical protein